MKTPKLSNESLKLTILAALCAAEETNILPAFDCATEDELKKLIQAIREVFPEFLKRHLIPIIRFTESPGSSQHLQDDFSDFANLDEPAS